jgi:hypothetical protein
LGNDDATLRKNSKYASCQLVDEMAKGVVVLLSLPQLLDRQLKLAFHLAQEYIVYYDVFVFLVKLILRSGYSKCLLRHLFVQ